MADEEAEVAEDAAEQAAEEDVAIVHLRGSSAGRDRPPDGGAAANAAAAGAASGSAAGCGQAGAGEGRSLAAALRASSTDFGFVLEGSADAMCVLRGSLDQGLRLSAEYDHLREGRRLHALVCMCMCK